MGFRQDTAFKVLPGVRLTIRDPGTGEQRPLEVRTVGAPSSLAEETATVRPGRRPAWEHRLHRSLLLGDAVEVQRVAGRRGHPLLGAALGGLTAYATGAGPAWALLGEAWRSGYAVEQHPFLVDRLAQATVRVDLTDDVHAVVPVSRDAVGLALIACDRSLGRLDAAIEVAEDLDPSVVAALTLADLYLRAGRTLEVIDLTEGVSNTDDAAALLMVQRAAALRACGDEDMAQAVLQDAIRWGLRDSAVRRVALEERDRLDG
jgi:hypothetical protein